MWMKKTLIQKWWGRDMRKKMVSEDTIWKKKSRVEKIQNVMVRTFFKVEKKLVMWWWVRTFYGSKKVSTEWEKNHIWMKKTLIQKWWGRDLRKKLVSEDTIWKKKSRIEKIQNVMVRTFFKVEKKLVMWWWVRTFYGSKKSLYWVRKKITYGQDI